MSRTYARTAFMVTALVSVGARVSRAQCADSSRASRPALSSHAAPMVYLGGRQADLLRVRNDLGRCGGSASLVRSALSLSPSLDTGRFLARVAPVAPRLEYTNNSMIPWSVNDGAMWAGRGASTAVSAGIRAEFDGGRVTVLLAPEYVTSANDVTAVLPLPQSTRSPFGSPWYSGTKSIDMPQRFGSAPYRQVTLGQSALEFRLNDVGAGVSSENLWWGPAIQNALVMSDNAAGVPQAYLRTVRPLRTRAGAVEARVLLGTLTESPYFDSASTNNTRSLSAAVVTLRTAIDTGLTIGIARAVYAPSTGQGGLPGHWKDVLIGWGTPIADDSSGRHDREQITSLFGRWVFPESGLEVYGEWAKFALPSGLREMIVDPQHDQGYTLGVQWADQRSGAGIFRLQAELTTLEQTAPAHGVTVPGFYTSSAVPQGYTQRGQVIGAAIGPGSSTQWIGADLIQPRWQAGLIAGRVRNDDDAFYARQTGPNSTYTTHDISLYAGLRGAISFGVVDLTGSLIRTHRLNYLFQTAAPENAWNSAFDVHNTTLRLAATTRF